MKKFDPTLYFITDSTGFSEEEFLRRCEEALKGGVTMMQLREKEKTSRQYLDLAQKLHKITEKYGVPLIIDDRADIAAAVGAEGVHLGQSDIPISAARRLLGQDKIIGATAKTPVQAKEAFIQGADYIGCGAIFPTTTKVKTVITPVEVLREVAECVPIPVNAIGGLNRDNISILENSDISGICAVSAIMKAANPQMAAAELLAATKKLLCRKGSGLKTALSIAGSDCSGGAGIQADIKSMTANGVYAMTVITALTAQNTLGVSDIYEVGEEFLAKQLDAVFEDIFPDAVKIGMVSSRKIISVIAAKLKQFGAYNIVVDPVMVATSGSRLIESEAVTALKELLFPIADLITPNIPEAEVLSGIKIRDKADMIRAAETIASYCGGGVLIKGGHNMENADDLLLLGGDITWFCGKHINNPNTHGTGCSLSSAIAANLAKGYDSEEAVRAAKEYITGAIADMLDLGRGNGPINHIWK